MNAERNPLLTLHRRSPREPRARRHRRRLRQDPLPKRLHRPDVNGITHPEVITLNDQPYLTSHAHTSTQTRKATVPQRVSGRGLGRGL